MLSSAVSRFIIRGLVAMEAVTWLIRQYTFARSAIYGSADDVLTSTWWRNVT